MAILIDGFAVADLPPEVVARLDPGGYEGPPDWWMAQWRQEFEDERPAPLPEPEPEPEDPPALAAYAAARERGLSPGAAAWAAVHDPEVDENEAEAG